MRLDQVLRGRRPSKDTLVVVVNTGRGGETVQNGPGDGRPEGF